MPKNSLIEAAIDGDDNKVEQLLKTDANVHRTDRMGNTALICAAKNGHENIVKKLIKAGADSTVVNKEGQSALMLAEKNNHHAVIKILKTALNTIENPTSSSAANSIDQKTMKKILDFVIENKSILYAVDCYAGNYIAPNILRVLRKKYNLSEDTLAEVYATQIRPQVLAIMVNDLDFEDSIQFLQQLADHWGRGRAREAMQAKFTVRHKGYASWEWASCLESEDESVNGKKYLNIPPDIIQNALKTERGHNTSGYDLVVVTKGDEMTKVGNTLKCCFNSESPAFPWRSDCIRGFKQVLYVKTPNGECQTAFSIYLEPEVKVDDATLKGAHEIAKWFVSELKNDESSLYDSDNFKRRNNSIQERESDEKHPLLDITPCDIFSGDEFDDIFNKEFEDMRDMINKRSKECSVSRRALNAVKKLTEIELNIENNKEVIQVLQDKQRTKTIEHSLGQATAYPSITTHPDTDKQLIEKLLTKETKLMILRMIIKHSGLPAKVDSILDEKDGYITVCLNIPLSKGREFQNNLSHIKYATPYNRLKENEDKNCFETETSFEIDLSIYLDHTRISDCLSVFVSNVYNIKNPRISEHSNEAERILKEITNQSNEWTSIIEAYNLIAKVANKVDDLLQAAKSNKGYRFFKSNDSNDLKLLRMLNNTFEMMLIPLYGPHISNIGKRS